MLTTGGLGVRGGGGGGAGVVVGAVVFCVLVEVFGLAPLFINSSVDFLGVPETDDGSVVTLSGVFGIGVGLLISKLVKGLVTA